MSKTQTILAYDGVCNLCNVLVRFVIKQDKKQKIQFIPLQSDAFSQYFSNQTEDMQSLLFLRNDKAYKRSSAILQLFKTLGGFWNIFLIFYVFPRFLRDAIYRGIAKSRYRVFGRTDTCQLPNESYANRFLD